jgi:heme-degrading monooxygenase HmoA
MNRRSSSRPKYLIPIRPDSDFRPPNSMTSERAGSVYMIDFRLAQMNCARLRVPLQDPSMTEFVEGLGAMNELADRSPGFVWRLTGENGDGTITTSADPSTIHTLSVWESLEHLQNYVYKSAHLEYLRRRRDWFLPHEHPESSVMWWIPSGRNPALSQGIARLKLLRADGPGPEAFTFRRPFPAPVLAG